MPKPTLYHEDQKLEFDLIETLLAGHKEWRPDLDYPQSHSDMSGAVRGLMQMYEVKRRPLAKALRFKCYDCEQSGRISLGNSTYETCEKCRGAGYVN